MIRPDEIGSAVTLRSVTFSYPHKDALAGIDLTVPAGSYCGIVGPNGCGKTTLAYLIAGIHKPTAGSIDTHGLRVGLVLSNPANQIVSLVVEEDIAFGPENMGLPGPQIRERIDGALHAIHSEHLRNALTSTLSGGQLAKIAYAGQLALDADVLVLDEGTVMLDPDSRTSLLGQIRELNADLHKTVIHITHRLEDLMAADRVLVMEEGTIRLTAGSAIDLARRLSRDDTPGIEPGPELLYRCFLRDQGIDDTDLRQATTILAERIIAAKASG
ncbi:MAG TPA: ATP-binding cassette domain-containing protein [Deltaproteobacteria bacterium]|nr:ATP-binding cassette domain-containing protein [Deltaproteobacteria bacterium]HPR56118.1 ATP-binding cassette domain-containing protein [Deltaproteobacteria bacterium]HXK48210.1 ATP-binding cassette domain-containing protein [Deltaproteobacteria bacterium]